jgi:hypothetical protein
VEPKVTQQMPKWSANRPEGYQYGVQIGTKIIKKERLWKSITFRCKKARAKDSFWTHFGSKTVNKSLQIIKTSIAKKYGQSFEKGVDMEAKSMPRAH